jgi:hypothetical protein
MPPDPDSRELLLALLLAERDKQLVHFEGVDTKAGLLLGWQSSSRRSLQKCRGPSCCAAWSLL